MNRSSSHALILLANPVQFSAVAALTVLEISTYVPHTQLELVPKRNSPNAVITNGHERSRTHVGDVSAYVTLLRDLADLDARPARDASEPPC